METLALGLLDLLLIAALLALGWGALSGNDLQRSVVHFIGFGLLLALIWLRLRAPDIALAEAAIGAGLTGALLLAALRDTTREMPGSDLPNGTTPPRSLGMATGLTLLTGGLAVLLALAYLQALGQADPLRLAEQIQKHLSQTGVSNPVTAVLLNFRAYDTLLELAVLLAAVLGIMALGPARNAYLTSGNMLSGLSRWLTPILILVSGYLLWVGAHAPGGAFQAGALLAGAGVLLRLAGFPDQQIPPATVLRGLIIAGVSLFLAVGLGLMLAGRGFLDYPPAWAGGLILLIETAATLGIATTLVLAFLGGAPPQWTGLPSTGQAAGGLDNSRHGEIHDD
jgi:multisubunit Na+/H+ antiporter MnhB subunit